MRTVTQIAYVQLLNVKYVNCTLKRTYNYKQVLPGKQYINNNYINNVTELLFLNQEPKIVLSSVQE
jgi:hypothetical protein